MIQAASYPSERRLVALACRVLAIEGLAETTLGHVSLRVDGTHLLVRDGGPASAACCSPRPTTSRSPISTGTCTPASHRSHCQRSCRSIPRCCARARTARRWCTPTRPPSSRAPSPACRCGRSSVPTTSRRCGSRPAASPHLPLLGGLDPHRRTRRRAAPGDGGPPRLPAAGPLGWRDRRRVARGGGARRQSTSTSWRGSRSPAGRWGGRSPRSTRTTTGDLPVFGEGCYEQVWRSYAAKAERVPP